MKLFTAKKGDSQRDFNLPETYHDLTWGQAMALIEIDQDDPDAMLKTVAAMTGIESDWWRDTTESNQFIQVAIECQQFMNDWAKSFNDPSSMSMINPVLIDGGLITLPDEIGQQSTGQYFDALTYQSQWRKQQESEEGIRPLDTFQLYEKVFRIYAYPSASNGPYNAAKAMSMNIDSVPFQAVIGWAYFFLTSPDELKIGTKTNVQTRRTQTRKGKQALSKLLRNLAFWQRSTN